MTLALQAVESLRYKAPRIPLPAALAALGIVYGDIGTSPLYAFKQAATSGGTLSPETITGIVSLILWSLIMIISVKYAILIMRADNHGEGGIVALLALLDARHAPPRTGRASLLVVGLVGAALLYGDGVITPAISVLSAVEGLKVDAPQLARFVVPVSVLILIGLFLVQRKGTGFIGNIFGPAMLLWFAVIGVLGLFGIFRAPAILAALSPFSALSYLIHAEPAIGFAVLGAAFLAVTGGEAMYADMGHFGRPADPARLVRHRSTLPRSELFRTRRAVAVRPGRDRQSVLSAGTQMGSLSHGGVCHGGDHHRVAGHHIGGLLPHPAIHPAWVPAPHARAPYREPGDGPDLHTSRELAPRHWHARSRPHLRLIGRTGGSLRHRCLDAHGDHNGARRPGRAAMGLQPIRRPGRKRTVPHRRSDFRRGERDQAVRRRLVSASIGMCCRVYHADLANRLAAARAAALQAAPARGRVRCLGTSKSTHPFARSGGDLHSRKQGHTAWPDTSSSTQSRPARTCAAHSRGYHRRATG